MVVALISIPSIRLKRRAELLLYPMTLLFLFPSWLIEHRYYIIPFSLFLLLREQESERAEAGIALFSIIVSLGLYLPVIERTFFL